MKKLFPLFLFLLSLQWVNAQQAVKLGVYNEAIGLPTYKIIKLPIHPTIQLGWDFRSRGGQHWRRTTGLELYYFYHKRMEHAIMLDFSPRISYQTNSGFLTGFSLGAGYKLAFLDGQKYRMENGEYVKSKHWGKSQFNIKAGIGFEQKISDDLAITLDYKLMAVYPFGDRIVPFTLNHFTGFGIKKFL